MRLPFMRRKRGSAPQGYVNISYGYDYAQHDYQAKWSWPWPPAPAHEQRSALTNFWRGNWNALPPSINFIPGVQQSKFVWNVPTSYQNTLKNQQYNAGYNLDSMSAYSSASLNQQIQQAWQNRLMGP